MELDKTSYIVWLYRRLLWSRVPGLTFRLQTGGSYGAGSYRNISRGDWYFSPSVAGALGIGNACALRHKILVEKNVLCIACRRYAISS